MDASATASKEGRRRTNLCACEKTPLSRADGASLEFAFDLHLALARACVPACLRGVVCVFPAA
jgi:hypothetical protein